MNVIKITSDMHNRKLEYILKSELGFSENIIKKLKQTEGVKINGEAVHMNRIMCKNEEVQIEIPEEKTGNIIPEKMELDILYEDCDIIAVNKPRNMPVHPSTEHTTGTLANGMVYYLKKPTFRVITRLDKDTSGVVLIAKNHLSAHKLNEEMRNGEIQKEYLAWVSGVPNPKEGIINAPICRGEGIRRIVSENGKEAVTKYKVEKVVGSYCLVRLNPITGRTHQLRVHMSYIGTPIYGDWLYGACQQNEKTRLHCKRIEFLHPTENKKMEIEAAMPSDM
ncbi:MAG: RluA family pseudouridine synthase [Clostridia bacterium]